MGQKQFSVTGVSLKNNFPFSWSGSSPELSFTLGQRPDGS